MKNLIYMITLMMFSSFLAACSNETNAENIKIKKEEQLSSQEEMVLFNEEKEKKDTVWLKEKALYQFKAVEGEMEYTVFLFAEDEQSQISEESSKEGNTGIPTYTGHYALYLAEKDSTVAYKQDVMDDLGSLTFHSSMVQVYPLTLGKNTVITITQPKDKVHSVPYFFAIHDGQMKNVQMTEEINTIVDTEIKTINQKFIQTAHFIGEQVWRYTTWRYDGETMTFVKQDETNVIGQKGENWNKLWTEKKENFFPFLNLELSGDVIDKAKQGIPIGSPYPIGTNISNIKKSDPHLLKEGLDEGLHYVMYPEITYYYEGITGIVTAVSIPGERMKTTLTKVKELFGTPDQEINRNNGGTRAIYLADKYSVEVFATSDGEVEKVYLGKR